MNATLTFAFVTVPAALTALWSDAVTSYSEWSTASDSVETPAPVAPPSPHRLLVVESRRLEAATGADLSRFAHDLDVVRHQDRTYLAFRSGPRTPTEIDEAIGRRFISRGASEPGGRIRVISSADELVWRDEFEFIGEGELLSPRLLSWNDQLFAYATQLEEDERGTLTPSVIGSQLGPARLWSDWVPLGLEGYAMQRTQLLSGMPLMTAYQSQPAKYAFEDPQTELSLLGSSDGWHWVPLQTGAPRLVTALGADAALNTDDDGTLFGVFSRGHHDSIPGSSLCVAPVAQWSDWHCTQDNQRYDGVRLFAYDGEVYLVGRRDVGSGDWPLPGLLGRLQERTRELATRKRCALWRYIKAERRVAYFADMPSKGDTCSAAVLPGVHDGQFIVYTQSSSLEGPDLPFGSAQRGPTYLYRHVIELVRRAERQHAVAGM